MPDIITLAIIAVTFLLAGTVKGVIGLGLPTVCLGLLTVALDLPTAMALLLVPSLVTNAWQAAVGGHALTIMRRLWPFMAAATATVWLGAAVFTRVDLAVLSMLLGCLLAAYAVLSLSGVRFAVAERQEAWIGPMAGVANGVLTGLTGSFVVPGVMYLQSLGMSRDMLIQAMGILFTASTLALALALQGNGLLSRDLGLMSAVGLVPALAGMMIGQRFRRRLSEAVFRRVFFLALLALGFYIIVNALTTFE